MRLAMRRRHLFATLAILAFAGVRPAHAAEPDLSAIHTIGVVPAIGYKIAFVNVGVTSDYTEERIVDDWGLDNEVFATVAARLRGRYAVRRVDADRSAFSTVVLNVRGNMEVPAGDLTAKVTDRSGLDAYLVIAPYNHNDMYHSTNVDLNGLGIYRAPGAIVYDYAFYRCTLIDARSNKILDTEIATLGEPSLFSQHAPIVEESLWVDRGADFNGAQRDYVHHALSHLVQDSLPWTLYALHLTERPQQ